MRRVCRVHGLHLFADRRIADISSIAVMDDMEMDVYITGSSRFDTCFHLRLAGPSSIFRSRDFSRIVACRAELFDLVHGSILVGNCRFVFLSYRKVVYSCQRGNDGQTSQEQTQDDS
jgi:hypothetical protein